ncbi:MAG: hypothetical protein H6925_01205 [Holosporaceae bacterium]|nr:MAG: hypothetical protein H6925_01205 [Holosporaceae bacterium]
MMYMRPSILPHLLHAIQKNTDHKLRPVSLFEVGPIYKGLQESDQSLVIGAAKTGLKQSMHWSKKIKLKMYLILRQM